MFVTQKNASRVITEVLAGRNLNDALAALWRNNKDISPSQRGAIQDICFGTLRHLGLLEQILARLLKSPLHEAPLRALLLAALYQLQFTRASSYAVVDHAVKVAAQTGTGKGKGLTNAILRNFLRGKDDLVAKASATEAGRFSHPAWWIKALRSAYPDQWEAILDANNQHPPMSLRVNTRQTSVPDYLALLNDAGIAARHMGHDAIMLARPVGVDQLPHFAEGWASVQDAGAQLAAHLLDVQNGQRVLDACAAPGGKSCHILEKANVELISVDNDSERLNRVRQNFDRIGLHGELITGDAATPQKWWDGKLFDRILADVPCSASGVVRRHPDIKWLRRAEDFTSFAQQQTEMIEALWPMLAKGGKLLYATCSIFPAENSGVADAFAARHSDAQRLELNALAPEHGQLLPNAEHDGFYYALFQKNA